MEIVLCWGYEKLPLPSHLPPGIRRISRKSQWMPGAGNGVRTRDPELGKLVLYQLSYTRFRTAQ